MIFGRVKPRPIEDLAGLTPERLLELSNGETQELVVVDRAQPLAFPLHTEMSDRFFADLG